MINDKPMELLRDRILADQLTRTKRRGDNPVVNAQSLKGSSHITSHQLRMGMLTRDRLASLEFRTLDSSLLFGYVKQMNYPESELKDAEEFLSSQPVTFGQTGHCDPCWDELFELGIDGLIHKNTDLKNKSRGEAADTYQSFIYALEGLSVMVETAGAGDDLCLKIAHAPPETFHEAIQLVWFVMLGIMIGDKVGLVGPGRLDVRLNRFYQRDLLRGEISSEGALKLIEDLYYLINDFERPGLAYGVMVGGCDAYGNDLTNDLSYLCLEALRRTNLVYPTVGICWHSNTPDDLTSLAVELISRGYTTPAFFNDQVIQEGLVKYGVPREEAWDYINSACVEITPCGSSNIWVASPYFSLCGILMEKLENQQDFTGYEDFINSYFELLKDKIALAVEKQNEMRESRRLYGGKPLQSVFTRDCMYSGKDIDDGGARYNWVECSFVGLANLVDSLKIIKELVFEERELSISSLIEVLDNDFAGNEQLRQKILHKYPKYGVNDSSVDSEIIRIMEFITAECAKYKMKPDNSHFVPGTFCWIMHQRLGEECGATPDGRKAGFPFADGAGPAQGREKLGPTAAINSVTSWNHSAMIGGSAFNMKFNKEIFNTPGAVEKLKHLVLAFLRKGGFETQINVVDNSVLKQALKTPDEYSDLVVRIGGYTDYFTRMSPQMQQEVILRTDYNSI